MARENEWMAFYEHFDSYFSPGAVRDGCHPRIFEHANPVSKAVVLVHGLTDSPHFLVAIGQHFHQALGFNVYMPLLHCHGLKEPQGMETVSLDEWKANVGYAINVASARCESVSVGGLSTGGTLSFYMACNNPKVTGDLYLFSAALDLAGGPNGLLGELKERLARTFLVDLLDRFDNNKPLIGVNPYRYARMDKDGVRELAHLIRETDDLLDAYTTSRPFSKRVFAAHSKCDSTASIAGVGRLESKSRSDRFCSFYIDETEHVSHASLVLKDPVCAAHDGKELEAANPVFDHMLDAITAFERR